jgi:hypothetical protein
MIRLFINKLMSLVFGSAMQQAQDQLASELKQNQLNNLADEAVAQAKLLDSVQMLEQRAEETGDKAYQREAKRLAEKAATIEVSSQSVARVPVLAGPSADPSEPLPTEVVKLEALAVTPDPEPVVESLIPNGFDLSREGLTGPQRASLTRAINKAEREGRGLTAEEIAKFEDWRANNPKSRKKKKAAKKKGRR